MKNKPKQKLAAAILSCVGGGPMERLAQAANRIALTPSWQVIAGYSPQDWRSNMAQGRAGRISARFGSMVRFPLESVWRTAKTPSGTICVPTTNPFFLPLLLVLTKPLHGRLVVPLVYDLYPDALAAGDMAQTDGVVAKLMTLANRYWFRHADGLVFIGKKMADHACETYGQPRARIVLETGADAGEFADTVLGNPAAQSELETWCHGKVIFGYVGNMGHVHDAETLAAAVPKMVAAAKTQRLKVGVVIAASGPGAEMLKKQWADLPSECVRFEPPLDDVAWARLLKRCDVALVTLKNSANRTSIPSKAFSAMAAGSALLAVVPADSDIADLVQKHSSGRVVAPGQVDNLVAALLSFASDEKFLNQSRENSFAALSAFYDLPALAERWQNFLHEVDSTPNPPSPTFDRAKRAFDLVAAASGLLAISPILLGAAGAIRLTMGNPVLFRQDRPGLHEKPFKLLKFRTMKHPEPGKEGPEHDGARLSALGKFLRASSVDELPTLLNVLLGDMSLVGPRPLLMRYLPRYSREQKKRHQVKPGLSGWAQINGRNSVSWDEKFRLDVWYANHQSFWLDFYILGKTISKVLFREGISQEGHATMPEFWGNQAAPASVREEVTSKVSYG